MSASETIDVRATRREEMIDVTSLVRDAVRTSGIAVALEQSSAPTVRSEVIEHLAELALQHEGFAHSEDNQHAHIESTLVRQSTSPLVAGAALVLGNERAPFVARV